MDINTFLKTFALSVVLSVCLFVHHVSGQTVVEGFVGGSVILPCTLTPNGELYWGQGVIHILFKPAGGPVIIGSDDYIGDVSLVNGDDLRISPLKRPRDGTVEGVNRVFTCRYNGNGGGRTETTLRLIDPVKITGVSIPEASNGRVTVRAGTAKTLTCSVSGDPKPAASYSWSVDGSVSAQTSRQYTFIVNTSMKTIKCTATNGLNDEVLSEKSVTVTLNVQFLDRPLIKDVSFFVENNTATLQCLAQGNPQPSFQWRKFTTGVVIQSAVYTIENVQRSAAGTYICTVYNSVATYSLTTELIVQYPPDVTVSYSKTTQTLTCRADYGVPDSYTFSQWEHRLDGKLLQTLETQSSGFTATLNLAGALTYEDTGYYVCQVSNGIKSPRRGQVFVTPESPAIFEKQTQIFTWKVGENNSVSVPFYTYSDTPNANVVWKKSGESTVLTSHREETGPVRLLIHDQSVGIEGTVTVLTLRNVTQSDEGNYSVTVTNDIKGVPQSNQMSFSLFVTLIPTSSAVTITNTSPISVGNGQANKQPGVKVAPIAGGAGGAVILILVIVILIIVVRRRSVNNKNTGQTPEEAIRPPEERTVAQFHNGPQEGGVYQDLTINPDYVNHTEDQPYATLSKNDREATDYEECDVHVIETKDVVRDSITTVPQYEDVSFSAQGAKPDYIDVYPENTENTDYQNTLQ